MSRERQKYKPFKAHFMIPFILSLTIIIAGIIMTLTDQTDLGYFKGRGSIRQDFVVTGPSVIIFGALLATILLYLKRFLK